MLIKCASSITVTNIFPRTIEREGLLDQLAFAFKRRAFEFDFERFTQDLHRAGVSMQCLGARA